MTNQFAFEVFCLGGAIPAFIAFAVTCSGQRFLPRRVAKRYAAACGIGIAFFVAYVLLPAASNASLIPGRFWHWLPYVAGVAMVLGPLGLARGLVVVERWALCLLVAVLAAWLLVPVWENLRPPRAAYVPLLAGYFLLLAVLLEPLPDRVSPRIFAALLWLAAACSAATVWVAVSETYGRVGALAASAWAGTCVASWLMPSATASRATALLYAVLVGGAAFVGFVYLPDKPEWIIMVVPATPLALWTCVKGPLARLQGTKAVAAQIAAVLIPLAVAAVLLVGGRSPLVP